MIANVTADNETVVASLGTDGFTEILNDNGTYTYETPMTVRADGIYEVQLLKAVDGAGNDGATGPSDSIRIETTPRSITNSPWIDATNGDENEPEGIKHRQDDRLSTGSSGVEL